jgi:F-type H+-transporting ATPase subunit c
MKRLIMSLSMLTVLVATIMAFAKPVNVSAKGVAYEEATAEVAVEATVTDQVAESKVKSSKSLAAAIAIGLAALGGAIAMGIAIDKSSEGISRQPEAEGAIRTSLMLGLVFIETAIIYALIVAILIIFVL